MIQTQTSIFTKFQIEGFHEFPLAKELFPEVGFLAERHRHIFWFECEEKVYHDNRNKEFIMRKRMISSFLLTKYREKPEDNFCEFGAMSCEAIARELLNEFELESCSVFEDNENGAKISRIK